MSGPERPFGNTSALVLLRLLTRASPLRHTRLRWRWVHTERAQPACLLIPVIPLPSLPRPSLPPSRGTGSEPGLACASPGQSLSRIGQRSPRSTFAASAPPTLSAFLQTQSATENVGTVRGQTCACFDPVCLCVRGMHRRAWFLIGSSC